jgi:hypothetical protein
MLRPKTAGGKMARKKVGKKKRVNRISKGKGRKRPVPRKKKSTRSSRTAAKSGRRQSPQKPRPVKPVKEEEYPNQSEPGKCELQINKDNKLYCLQQDGCRGECILYSIPQGKPKAKPRIEKQPVEPDPDRYYFCRCLEL